MCGCFSMWHIVASRFKSEKRKQREKNTWRRDFESIQSLEKLEWTETSNSPDVLSPGLAVNFATSTILTANCNLDSRCMHRRTIEKGPLQIDEKKMVTFLLWVLVFSLWRILRSNRTNYYIYYSVNSEHGPPRLLSRWIWHHGSPSTNNNFPMKIRFPLPLPPKIQDRRTLHFFIAFGSNICWAKCTECHYLFYHNSA